MAEKNRKAATHAVTMSPSGRRVDASAGSVLRKILFTRDTEMPCGGQGECRACRIRLLEGQTEPSAIELRRFKPEEIAEGWRLSCQTKIDRDMSVEVAPWMEKYLVPEKKPGRAGHALAGIAAAAVLASALRSVFRRRQP